MLVLIGKSASGKSTIEKILVEKYNYNKIVSYTTRPPRIGEVDGIDYHFISVPEFKKLKEEGMFAETASYNNWHYGSAKEDYTSDKVAVLTPHGLRQILKDPALQKDIVSIYIDVDRRDRFIKILSRADDIEEAKRRDGSDVGQFDGVEDEVDHTINNDGYKNNAESMARQVDFMYKVLLKEKRKIKTIFCDIDEVINDLVSRIIELYNIKYDDTVKLDDIVDYDMSKFLKPECKNVFEEFCTDSFLFNLKMKPETSSAINKLMNGYEFYFVSSKHPSHVSITDKWLKANIEGYDSSKLIICKNKKLISGDILIDDCLDNFETDNNKVSNVRYNLIFDKPWNKKCENSNRNFRVHNWDEVLNIITKLEGIE